MKHATLVVFSFGSLYISFATRHVVDSPPMVVIQFRRSRRCSCGADAALADNRPNFFNLILPPGFSAMQPIRLSPVGMRSMRPYALLALNTRSPRAALKARYNLPPYSTHYGLSRLFATSVRFHAQDPSSLKSETSPSPPASSTSQPKKFSLRPYMDLMRMGRPIGTYLLYAPCAWSITMAAQYTNAHPNVWLTNLALFAVGAFVMRSAGCVINDMWDAKIDAKVERTKSRPIASGAVSYGQATTLLGLQLSTALAILLQLNTYSIVLGLSLIHI